jgi:hypothetical protein
VSRADVVQPDLFSGTQVVLRRLEPSGTTVRLRLRPLGGRRVRLEEAERRPAGASEFSVWASEVGREVDFDRLGLTLGYEALFPGD